MVDIVDSKWSERDAQNNAAAPNGWQSGYLANTIAPTGRQMMAAMKRWFNSANAIYTTTGGSNAYVLTFEQGPPEYKKGLFYAFFLNHTNTGPATLNIQTLGAKAIVRHDGTALTAGQMQSGTVAMVYYDGTSFRLFNSNVNPKFGGTLEADAITTGNLTANGKLTVAGQIDASNYLNLNGVAGSDRFLGWKTNNIQRWALYANGAAETGDAAGTNLAFARYADNGNYIDSPLIINRQNGNINMSSNIAVAGGNVFVNSGGNSHYWYQHNGVGRAVTYVSPGANSWNVNLYNADGSFNRALSYNNNGNFDLSGNVNATGVGYFGGEIKAGPATYQTDGNIQFAGGMTAVGSSLFNALNAKQNNLNFTPVQQGGGGGQANSKIYIGWRGADGKLGLQVDGSNFGWRWPLDIDGSTATIRDNQSGNPMKFNWNGQGGQPDWLWGGSNGADMYVYSPNNMTVKNSAQLGGLAASDYATKNYVWDQIYKSDWRDETVYPGGHQILAADDGTYARNSARALYLFQDGAQYVNYRNGAGAMLAGTWRSRGYTGAGSVQLFQRVG